MDELAKSLHFIIYHEVNKMLDCISIDFNINREELNKYAPDKQYEIETNNENCIIIIPVISDDDETTEISLNQNELTNNNDNNPNSVGNSIINIKCKQMTRKGKQCDYNSKPNSEYCGRHSK